jgi:hypothetical protein
MFRFVYYYTLKQQIWELEMAIQRVARWLATQHCWVDVKICGYIRIEIQQNMVEFDQRKRDHKEMLSTDKCTLQTLKKELHAYSTLRRRTPNIIHHYSDWME